MKDIRNDLLKVTCELKRSDNYTWAYPNIIYNIFMPIFSRIRIDL